MIGVLSAGAIALSTPSIAQVHVDVPGVGVHVGSDHNHRHNHRGYRARAQADCRQVTTRTVRPNGTVVVKKRTNC
jgi:hypothetical protein